MPFNEKLSFLMDVTQTSNSALSHAVKLDASYISRLRCGKRLCPRDDGCIHAMAGYFARHCTADYQRRAIGDALTMHALPEDASVLSSMLADWLISDKYGETAAVGRFLGGLSGMGASLHIPPAPTNGARTKEKSQPIEAFYGINGKRQAVRRFLSEVAEHKNPQTLLLFSDEETGWMTEDLQFAREWAALMLRVLAKGNRIRIVHTIQRDLHEMLHAISQWMPLYMSGAIEPYFYPKKRDGLFKRTLFIAPETSAVVSSSMGSSIEQAANLLFHEPAAVAAYTEEILQYIRLCRPLMRIFTQRELNRCTQILFEFEQEQADTILSTESLSMLTMPEALLERMLNRAGIYEKETLSFHAARRQRFFDMLANSSFTELISLPDWDAVCEGCVRLTLSEILCGGALSYTAKEYLEHIGAIIQLMERFPNYRVRLVPKSTSAGYAVYARDGLGVFVFKSTSPPVVLAMNEANMVAAFWDYLHGMASESTYRNPGAEAVSQSLQSFFDNARKSEIG